MIISLPLPIYHKDKGNCALFLITNCITIHLDLFRQTYGKGDNVNLRCLEKTSLSRKLMT